MAVITSPDVRPDGERERFDETLQESVDVLAEAVGFDGIHGKRRAVYYVWTQLGRLLRERGA